MASRRKSACDEDTPSFSHVRVDVQNLVYLLGKLRGFWLEECDSLAEWLRRTRGLPLANQESELNAARHQLSFIFNHEKADLSRTQQESLRHALVKAMTCIDQWRKAIPDELKAEQYSRQEAKNFLASRASKPVQPKRKSNRGRKPDTDPKEDQRIYDGWRESDCRSFEEYTRVCGRTKREIVKAVDRHKKRLQRGRDK